MADIDLTIPDFLLHENSRRAKLTDEQQARLTEWMTAARSRVVRRCKKRRRFDLPESIEPAGAALLKQIEKAKEERQKARFAELRERARR